MSLFDQLNSNPRNNLPDRQHMANLVSQLQSNPMSFLQQMGYNIPAGMNLNDPNAIIGHLMNTKQINGGLLSKAQQLLRLFM